VGGGRREDRIKNFGGELRLLGIKEQLLNILHAAASDRDSLRLIVRSNHSIVGKDVDENVLGTNAKQLVKLFQRISNDYLALFARTQRDLGNPHAGAI